MERFSFERIKKLYYKQAIMFGIGMVFFIAGVVCTVCHFMYEVDLTNLEQQNDVSQALKPFFIIGPILWES